MMLPVLAGCEIDVPVTGMEDRARIWLHCIARPGENVEVLTAVAFSLQNGCAGFSPAEVVPMVKINGVAVEVVEDQEYEPEYEGCRKYVSESTVKAGDVLEVAAESPDTAPVRSRTVVPEAAGDFTVRMELASTDKSKPKTQSGTVVPCRKFTIDIPQRSEESYYGVRVRRLLWDDAQGGYDRSEYLSPLVWETEQFISSREYDMWVGYDDGFMQIYKVKAGVPGSLEIMVPMTYVSSGNLRQSFDVEVYSLSPEFWRYSRAAYIEYMRVGFMLMFMYPSFIYSDVEDGLGLLASVNCSEISIDDPDYE